MAKSSGLGDNLYAGGYDLSGDTQSLKKISGSVALLDVTGIDKDAHERIGGRRDGAVDWTAFFNPAAGQAHAALSTLPTTDVHVVYCRGTTLGSPSACMLAKQVGYDPTRGADGALTLDVSAVAKRYGLEWGVQLTAGKRTDTTATDGTSVDLTAVSTTFGWQAYAQFFSVTGTSVTLTIQDSADNVSFANLSGGAFAAVAAAGAPSGQRIAGGTGDTVRRYLRVSSSGTFSSAVFAVAFVRNATSVVF